jgi:hypothetical protein
MLTKLTNKRTFVQEYYTYCIPPTCFGHSCGHLQRVQYEGYILQSITEVFETMNRYIYNIDLLKPASYMMHQKV